MLERLVSSRIRRALFEYILTHPHDRFYLRGLAKALNLSISPLRRELKQLEHAGMLRVTEEANIRFYTVNTESVEFLQLRQATLPPRTQEAAPSSRPQAPGQSNAVVASSLGSSREANGGSALARLRAPLHGRLLVGAVCAGLGLVLIVAGAYYRTFVRQQTAASSSSPSRRLAASRMEMTVIVPPSPSTGVMRGAHWQIVPGGFGGFSSGSSSESY